PPRIRAAPVHSPSSSLLRFPRRKVRASPRPTHRRSPAHAFPKRKGRLSIDRFSRRANAVMIAAMNPIT
ncbi:hypothetical protein COL27_32615, partial [Bacillus sp. AFS075960]